MKRVLLAVAGLSMFIGCASQSITPAAGPAKADYFEVNKNGQMYVFSDVKAMQTFIKTGESGPTVSDYYGSKIVSFQNTGDQQRLVTEYEKQHK